MATVRITMSEEGLDKCREKIQAAMPELKEYCESQNLLHVHFISHNGVDPENLFDCTAKTLYQRGKFPEDPITAIGNIGEKLYELTGLETEILLQDKTIQHDASALERIAKRGGSEQSRG